MRGPKKGQKAKKDRHARAKKDRHARAKKDRHEEAKKDRHARGEAGGRSRRGPVFRGGLAGKRLPPRSGPPAGQPAARLLPGASAAA